MIAVGIFVEGTAALTVKLSNSKEPMADMFVFNLALIWLLINSSMVSVLGKEKLSSSSNWSRGWFEN